MGDAGRCDRHACSRNLPGQRARRRLVMAASQPVPNDGFDMFDGLEPVIQDVLERNIEGLGERHAELDPQDGELGGQVGREDRRRRGREILRARRGAVGEEAVRRRRTAGGLARKRGGRECDDPAAGTACGRSMSHGDVVDLTEERGSDEPDGARRRVAKTGRRTRNRIEESDESDSGDYEAHQRSPDSPKRDRRQAPTTTASSSSSSSSDCDLPRGATTATRIKKRKSSWLSNLDEGHGTGPRRAQKRFENDWLHRFAPNKPSELAIHYKKKNQLVEWFSQAVHHYGQHAGQQKLLILSGPTGCGARRAPRWSMGRAMPRR